MNGEPKKPHALPGSRLWRVWCYRCGEPMRVNASDVYIGRADEEVERPHYCGDCAPTRPPAAHTGLTKRQRAKVGKTDGG